MTSSTKELQERIVTCGFDVAYEKALHAAEKTLRDEEARQLRLQLLLAQAEEIDVRCQLSLSTAKTDTLERGKLRAQYELEMALRNCEKADSDLRSSLRKNEALEAEIRSLSNLASNSEMLVAEKLSLASELASLRAEIQHLKSQVASNQALLSQKLALEGDLSSLQQDLETLRRSAQIAQTAQQRTNSENERLENRISILEAELAEERLQREKNERNAQKASSDWESTKTSLESHLNVSRNKLRVATEKLKTCRFELNDSRNTVGPSDLGSLDADRGRGGTIKPSLKRNSVQQLDADSMIGTPGDMPAAKKIKKGLALPGDKSAFSITPFLNRASGAGLESPHGHIGPNIGFGDKEKSYDHLDDQVETDETPVNRIKAKQPVSKTTRLPAQVTQVESCETGRKVISNKKGSSTRKSRISHSLENVSEAEENTEDPLLLSKTTRLVTDVPEKRKRRVWAGSLLKPVPKEILQTTASTFGYISPLKKNKRAVPVDSREAPP